MIPTPSGRELKKRERRGTWYAIIGLVILLGGLYVAGHFLLGNRLPTGTRIAGVGVGGLTPEQAEARLEADLAPHTKQTLTFYYEDLEYEIKPEDIGLELHIEQSVASAGGGRTWNPVEMLETIVGADRLDPVVTVDQKSLDKKLDEIASDIDVAPVEPRVRFQGNETDVRRSEPGRQVNRAALEDLVREQFVQDHQPEGIPVATDKPNVTGAELNAALDGKVKTAVGAPVRIRVAGEQFTLSAADVRSMLSYVSADGELSARIDNDRFRQLVKANTKDVRKPARPATVVIRGGAPKVVADVPGRGVRTGDAGPRLVRALERRSAKLRVVALERTTTRAGFRTDDAKQLGIVERVGSYTTRFRRGRGVDVGTIAGSVDGTVLRPGDTFSFNRSGGRPGRSGANGDGASQVASTVFNAGLLAGLGVPERHAHHSYVSRLPVGRDAAVTYGGRDLRLKNDTGHGVLISARADAGDRRTKVHVELWSTKRWNVKLDTGSRQKVKRPVRHLKGKRCSPRPGVPGFSIEVVRTLVRNGDEARDHTFSSTYEAVPRIRCHGRR
ncbi:VanW family protein [Solicola gregarius]|uniref:Peptidoglycan binding domain-containing protein n=1 Tax=Solicola gregarius TaxID=2908642 RepID=A0AA46TKP6_9ACTN|nr:peptidoglycan binding domain-containing protein [Solicola gregarius]UYM06203.1 peptidoglycan binding domain-containing protein [Solicola gregarius]